MLKGASETGTLWMTVVKDGKILRIGAGARW